MQKYTALHNITETSKNYKIVLQIHDKCNSDEYYSFIQHSIKTKHELIGLHTQDISRQKILSRIQNFFQNSAQIYEYQQHTSNPTTVQCRVSYTNNNQLYSTQCFLTCFQDCSVFCLVAFFYDMIQCFLHDQVYYYIITYKTANLQK